MSSQKIVVVGAGSLQFGLGTCGSIFNSKVLDGATISLHDINAENLEYARAACQDKFDHDNLNFTLESTTVRKEALKGANFVISAIEVGPRFHWWDIDKKIPWKYGSTQVFGENGGPGGMFHAMRIVPPILDICGDIMKIAPSATFINYSNPMSRICLSIKRKYPDLKTIGLCHEIAHAQFHLPRMLKIPFNEMEIGGYGLNHFGSIITAKNKKTSEDLIPEIRNKGVKHFKRWSMMFPFSSAVKITGYILKDFGYVPYTTDSHFGEYFGWARSIANMSGIRRFYFFYKNVYTRYHGISIRSKVKRNKGYKAVRPDDERAIPIIEGILSDDNHRELSVNLPNDGIITNLPEDLVVECPATVDKTGVHGVPLGEYPEPLVDLLKAEANIQDLVVKAILNNSRDYAVQALMADNNFPRKHLIDPFLDEMLEIQKEWVQLS
ncbi:MAG: family 4 glycosyl hydrolase [Promethearchaeota archaeon]